MKFGFEREFFVMNDKDEYVFADSLPRDDCGYLAEARGEPHWNPISALGLYNADQYNLEQQANKLGLKLVIKDYEKLSAQFIKTALRRFGKNAMPLDEGSMYGKFWSGNIQRAGLHVHFSNQTIVKTMTGGEMTIPGIIDMPRFIFGLDRIFEKEIKEAKRVPGLYEMKVHGFEYRSLPASIDMTRVAEALVELQGRRWSSDFDDGE